MPPQSFERILSWHMTVLERFARGPDDGVRAPDESSEFRFEREVRYSVTPLEKVESLYGGLVAWYGEGTDAETRAAAKLLMVGLAKLKEHGGDGWYALAQEYLIMAQRDPERFQRALESNRGEQKMADDGPHGVERFLA